MDGVPATLPRLTCLPALPSTTTSGKAIAVILKPLIDLHGEPRNWVTAAPLYIRHLDDIPAELLQKAVDRAITTNPYFPKPAELRSYIAEELSLFRWKRDQEALAALPPPPERPKPTPEDFAYVRAVVAKATGAVINRSIILKQEADE